MLVLKYVALIRVRHSRLILQCHQVLLGGKSIKVQSFLDLVEVLVVHLEVLESSKRILNILLDLKALRELMQILESLMLIDELLEFRCLVLLLRPRKEELFLLHDILYGKHLSCCGCRDIGVLG